MSDIQSSPTGNPTIITQAKTLARAADTLEALSKTRPLAKNTILNALAAAICGPKHNWGFLKGQDGPVRDARTPAAPRPATEKEDTPLVFGDLSLDSLFAVDLPGGKTGYLPKAHLKPREDGGIDIICITWGNEYFPKTIDPLITLTIPLTSEQVKNLATEWPTPASLRMDLSWGCDAGGNMATLSEKFGELALYHAAGYGVVIIDSEELHSLAHRQQT